MSDYIMFRGFKVMPSQYISDYSTVRRTWKERLFELPWRPLVKTKKVPHRYIWSYDNKETFWCSYKTYSDIINGVYK